NKGAQIGSYEGDAVTPAFAVVYKPSARISLYANYSEALIPGQTAPADSGGVPVSNAGEVLDPFRGEQAEVGANYDGGMFGGWISLFHLTLPIAFVENNVFAANGEEENTGIELSLFGEPVEGLRLLGGATWLDAEMTRTAGGGLDGNAPIGAPEFLTNLNLEREVLAGDGRNIQCRSDHTDSQL